MTDPLPDRARHRLADILREGQAEDMPHLGRYRLLRELGRGAAGIVYEAEDSSLRRRVAVKVLHAALSSHLQQRFRREAEAAAAVSHPNVVALYDAGDHEGSHYLVMELVEGQSLHDWMAKNPVDSRITAALLEKIARGVGAAHARGIVHRDLKPGNILITAAGEPKVGDFGLAHVSESDKSLTREGAQLGTPLYMSPEQVAGSKRDIGPASDVWALGVLLYEMSARQLPFDKRTIPELYHDILDADPAPLRRVNPAAPREIEIIAAKALDKEASRRYPDATAFADDLRRFLDGEPVLARSSGFAWRLWKRTRRRAALVAAVVLASVAAVVALALGLRSRQSEAELGRERTLNEISTVYFDLAARTVDPIRLLEDRWYDGILKPVPEHRAALDEIRAAAAAHPDSRIAAAWVAYAEHLTGDPTATGRLDALSRAAGDDPFPALLQARALLASYAKQLLPLPELYTYEDQARLERYTEPEEARRLRESAMEAVGRAAASPLFGRLRHGREYVQFARAAESLGRGHFDEAGKGFEALGRLFREAPMLRGSCKLMSGRSAEAIELLESSGWAIALDLAAMARVLGALSDASLRREAFEQAIRNYDETLRRNPDFASAAANRAMVRSMLGREPGLDAVAIFTRGIEDADLAVRLAPRNSYARVARAFCRRGLADAAARRREDPLPYMDRAVADLEEALALDDSSRTVVINLSGYLARRGTLAAKRGGDPIPDCTRGKKLIDDLLARMPDDLYGLMARAAAWNNLGLAYELKREDGSDMRRRAVEDYDAVLARDRTLTRAYVGRARARQYIQGSADRLRNLELSLDDLTTALGMTRAPDVYDFRVEVHVERARELTVLQRLPEAAAAYASAIADGVSTLEMDPRFPGALFRRAFCWLSKGGIEAELRDAKASESYEKSIVDGTAAIEEDPTHAEAWCNRALARISLAARMEGRPAAELAKGALEDYRKAAQLKPTYVKAWAGIGRVSEAFGLKQDARNAWSQVLELRPRDEEAQRRLKALGE